MRILPIAELGKDPGFEERLHQCQHALVLNSLSHAIHQGRVVNGVKTCLDISVEHPTISSGAKQVNLSDRVLSAPLGPKPIGDRLETGLKNWLQHQLQRRLNNPISDSG